MTLSEDSRPPKSESSVFERPNTLGPPYAPPPPPPPPAAPPPAGLPNSAVSTRAPKQSPPQEESNARSGNRQSSQLVAEASRKAMLDIKRRENKRRWWTRKSKIERASAAEHLAAEKEQRRQIPSWLVSFVFHLALLLVLALIPIQQFVTGPLTLLIGESSDSGDAEFALSGQETSEIFDNSVFEELKSVEPSFDPTEQLQALELPNLSGIEPVLDSTVSTLENIPFGIKNGLSGRSGALKDALLAKFGGTAETEAAVELGLQWLAKQQKSNGSWSLTGPYSSGGTSENTTAATAMAINAFLGAGYTQLQGKYADNLKLGLAYLVRRQDSQGFFSDREPSRQQMYAQALASIAVTEAYGMSSDEDLRIAAQKAIGFAEWSQSNLHGWRYEPRREADLSVTGWFVMALETGKMAGLNVDEKKLDSVNRFLDSVGHEQDSRYAYTDYEPPSLSMTAEGLLCRIYLGWPRSHPALLAAIHDDLLPNKPRQDEEEYSVYYWYYATQVLHHVGGPLWDDWNQAMRKVLPAMQTKAGKEAGSWDPSRDMFGASGGRLYTTCLNLYCLEVYYRHLSLYDLR